MTHGISTYTVRLKALGTVFNYLGSDKSGPLPHLHDGGQVSAWDSLVCKSTLACVAVLTISHYFIISAMPWSTSTR